MKKKKESLIAHTASLVIIIQTQIIQKLGKQKKKNLMQARLSVIIVSWNVKEGSDQSFWL